MQTTHNHLMPRPLVVFALSTAALWACDAQPPEDQQDFGRPGEVDGGMPGRRFERARPLRARQLSVGAQHACVITDTGRLVCWGGRAELGLLGGWGHRFKMVSVGDTSMLAPHDEGGESIIREVRPDRLDDGRLVFARPRWYPGSVRDLSVVNAAGRNSGCEVNGQGSVICLLDVAHEDLGAVFADEVFFGTHTSLWAELEATSLVPHSGLVGCARRTSGDLRCWAAGVAREMCPPHEGVQVACRDHLSWYYTPQAIELPAKTAVCVAPTVICTAEEGGIDCRAISAQRGDRETFGEHRIGPPVRAYEVRDQVRALACASNSGPILGEPPYHTRICVLDAAGRALCGLDGAPLMPVFDGGPPFVEVETSLWLTCGLTADGKVRCVRWQDGGDEVVAMPVPGGLLP